MPNSPRAGAAVVATAARCLKTPLAAITLLATLLVSSTLVAHPAFASTSSTPESSHWFSKNSVWRKPLSPHATIDRSDQDWVTNLVNDVNAEASPWINTTSWSTPVYNVPKNQKTFKVTLTNGYAPLQNVWLHVPVPTKAVPSVGNDSQMVIWQESTNKMWEFWDMHKDSSGNWTAAWGGYMGNVARSPGYFQAPNSTWGATATSLPLLGGLITIDDLRRGSINHALALAVPNTMAAEYVFPAQRTDGDDYNSDAIPEGARFRLPAKLNLNALHLPKVTLELARAAQKYGIILRDTSGNVTFYAQDPTPTGSNPYMGATGFWGKNTWPNSLMKAFPWSDLQVVKAPIHHGW